VGEKAEMPVRVACLAFLVLLVRLVRCRSSLAGDEVVEGLALADDAGGGAVD
jgi:hypothetical protein